jgi:NodT family efflux transporter outer membrane factor (OMF) lipoprotein
MKAMTKGNSYCEMRVFEIGKVLAIAALLGALSACNITPKYVPPPPNAPQAYKEAAPTEYKEGTGWRAAAPKDDQISVNWWDLYQDRDLAALEEQVKNANYTIAQAEATFRQARALTLQARAQLYPSITTSPSYSNSRSSPYPARPGQPTTSPALNTFSLPFDATWQPDLFGRLHNTVAENALQAQASAGDLAASLLTLQSELAVDYYEVRSLDDQKHLLDATVAAYRDNTRLTSVRFDGGIASEEDVSEAETQLDSTIAQATDVGVARSQYEHAIAVLIGKTPANFELAVAPFHSIPPPIPVGIPSELLERRPDIAAAERRIAAANAEIGIAKSAFYPTLTLSAAAGLTGSSLVNWFTWPARVWSVGPQLAQTLFEVGGRQAVTAQAIAIYDGAVANYRQTVLTAFQNVEDNLSALRVLAQERGEQETAVKTAQKTLDLAMVRYTGGVDSYLNVITAQTALLTSQLTQISIELRQMTASVQLAEGLGGGWNIQQLPALADMTAKNPQSPNGLPVPVIGSNGAAPAASAPAQR